MRWALDPEQQMFSEALSDWLDDAADSASVRDWLDRDDATGFEERLVSEGWLSVGVPEESDGQGGGLLELALVAEHLGRHAAPSGAWLSSVVALPALEGSDALAETIEGGRFAALAVESSGFPDAPPRFTVDAGRLHGSVALALGADRAARLVVPAEGDAGVELYLVEVDSPGVTVTPVALLDRSRGAASIVLDGAEGVRLAVDAADVLTRIALRSAVLVAADSLGAASRMLQLAVDYSKQRRQYGVPIGSFQAMKHAAATMLVDEEASRSIVYYAAATVEERSPEASLHAAAAKAQAGAAAVRTADSSLAMHGAIGYTWEHDLQLFYKRATTNASLFGDSAAWNERLADLLDLVPASAEEVSLIGQSIDMIKPNSIPARH